MIDPNNNISIAQVFFLDYDNIKDVSIWDLEHKKKNIEEKK